MTEAELIGRLDGLLTGVLKSLERIENSLYTGGGYLERLTKVENSIEGLLETNKEQTKNIQSLSDSVSDLKILMESHTKEKKQHFFINQLMTDKKLAFFIIGGIFVLFEIFTNIPIGWSWLLKILGF